MNLLENYDVSMRVTVAETWQISFANTSLEAWPWNCPSWFFHMLQRSHRAFIWYTFVFEIRCSRTRFLPPNFLDFWSFTAARKVVIFGLPKAPVKIQSAEIFPHFLEENRIFFKGVEDGFDVVRHPAVRTVWTWSNFPQNVTADVTQSRSITFRRFSGKWKLLEKFVCDFRK